MEKNKERIKLIECPRDAMQGIHTFIPTDLKVKYLNELLEIGFDTLDFGSFVSEKAIPQMKDTREIVKKLLLHKSATKLLAIVANKRGALDACSFDEIEYLGYPFSVSEIFQKRNTNLSIEQSFTLLHEIQELCSSKNRKLVVYLSMGFGNPYGEAYSTELVQEWVDKIAELDITIMSFSDTVGVASPEQINEVYTAITPFYPQVEFGVHLHSHPAVRQQKLEAAYKSGCSRFDGALLGYGGCPMANDDLVGNMATEIMIQYFRKNGIELDLNIEALHKAQLTATEIFGRYH